MVTVSRRPCPELTPWVERIWASAPAARGRPSGPVAHVTHAQGVLAERVLPTGTTHVVWRDAMTPLTLLTDQGRTQAIIPGKLIVGGIRSASYCKQVTDDASTVGVQLKPGGALVLLGAPADEFSERHTALESVWGHEATGLLEQLYGTNRYERGGDDPAGRQHRLLALLHDRVNTLEAALKARAGRLEIDLAAQRWIACCAEGLQQQVPLAQLVRETGVSHRTFITRFRRAVGLPPKLYARIRRFQRLIEALPHSLEGRGPGLAAENPCFAQLAADTGYSDQAHLCRDFREFTGLSPTGYLRLAPASPNHVRLSHLPGAAGVQFPSRR
jgi:AraC-like DNA-binding protein